MRGSTVLFPVVLSLSLALSAGCSLVEENQKLTQENAGLEKQLAEVTMRYERLQRKIEREKKYSKPIEPIGRREDMAKPAAVKKVSPSRNLTFSEADLDDLARKRAKVELANLNLSITSVNEMHGKVGNDTLEYAKAFKALEAKQAEIRNGQKFYKDLIEPDVLAMPPAPSENVLTRYAAELAEEQTRREEQARLQAEREEAERKAAEEKDALDATKRAAEEAAAAAREAAAARKRDEVFVPRLQDGVYVP